MMRRSQWAYAEPTVEELLDDPIAHLLMGRDGLRPEQVWAYVNDARRKLRDHVTRSGPQTGLQRTRLVPMQYAEDVGGIL